MRINLYQERDFGQVINATVEFIRQNLRPLARCLLLVALPATLILTLASQLLMLSSLRSMTESPVGLGAMSQIFSLSYWLAIGLSSITHLFLTGTVYGYMLEYEAGNPDIQPAHIWPRLGRSLPAMLFILPLAGFAIIVSSFLFFFPAIYLAVCFSLLQIIRMREGNASVPLVRCTELMGSPWWSPLTGSPFFFWLLFLKSIRVQVTNFWTTLGLIGVCTFLLLVLQVFVSLPMLVMGLSDGLFKTRLGLSQQSQWIVLAQSLFSTTVATFAGSILPIALGFQYYNLLDQREGGGLLAAVETIGQQAGYPDAQRLDDVSQLRTEDEGDY